MDSLSAPQVDRPLSVAAAIRSLGRRVKAERPLIARTLAMREAPSVAALLAAA